MVIKWRKQKKLANQGHPIVPEWCCQSCAWIGVLGVSIALFSGCGSKDEPEPASSFAPDKTEQLVVKSLPNAEQGVAEQIEPEVVSTKNRLPEADADGDGHLTKQEFRDYLDARAAQRPPVPPPTPAQLKKLREGDARQPILKGERMALLSKFDHDRDGAFSPAEKAEAQAYLDARERARREKSQ